jgi:aspartyl-tRNA synthetase
VLLIHPTPALRLVEATRLESVVTITGTVLRRSDDTINNSLPTGHIEVRIEEFVVQSAADTLPLQVNSDEDSGEETRLRYRYLDLRRNRPHSNIMLRAADYPIDPQPHGGTKFSPNFKPPY